MTDASFWLYGVAVIFGWIGGGLVNWAADLLPGAPSWGVARQSLWRNRSHYWRRQNSDFAKGVARIAEKHLPDAIPRSS
ncbi:MAG: hypothetical protein IPM07_00415 [Anaerolineales bacterium]|nr:hypothetical protein [Anaerolineales bacterium]